MRKKHPAFGVLSLFLTLLNNFSGFSSFDAHPRRRLIDRFRSPHSSAVRRCGGCTLPPLLLGFPSIPISGQGYLSAAGIRIPSFFPPLIQEGDDFRRPFVNFHTTIISYFLYHFVPFFPILRTFSRLLTIGGGHMGTSNSFQRRCAPAVDRQHNTV